MLPSPLRRRPVFPASGKLEYLAPSVRPGIARRRRLVRTRSHKRFPARRAWARQPRTLLHAHPRKGKAALDCGSGSSPLRITAPRPSRLTQSAGRETWLSSHPSAHTGTVPTQTAANASQMQQSERPPQSRSEPARMEQLAPAESGLLMCASAHSVSLEGKTSVTSR